MKQSQYYSLSATAYMILGYVVDGHDLFSKVLSTAFLIIGALYGIASFILNFKEDFKNNH